MKARNIAGPITGTGASIYKPSCPACGKVINLQAVVDAFMTPPKWQFWGEPGKRAKQCEGEFMTFAFTHFAVQVGRKAVSHRLAWVNNEETA